MALLSHLKLDDYAASTTYLATVGNNATRTGGDNTDTAGVRVPGPGRLIPWGTYFNGTDDGANWLCDMSGTGKITIAMWIKTAGTTGILLERHVNALGSNGAHYLYLDTAAVAALHNDVSGYTAVAVAKPSGSVWHHIMVVHDKSIVSTCEIPHFYIDGVEVTRTETQNRDSPNLNTFNNQTLYLANRGGSSLWYQGAIADIRLYDTVEPLATAYALYNMGRSQVWPQII